MVAQRRLRGDRAPSELECPRVLIADDRVATRLGVRLALEQDGFVVCAEANTGRAAVASALDDPPDVCLVELHVPGGALEAVERIRSQLPATEVVILGDSQSDEHLFAALEAGASGYLLDEMSSARLGPTLRDVLNGRAALPRSLTARLIDEFRVRAQHGQAGPARRTARDLTAREWDVLDCLREGLSTRRIAKRLFISETTVRRHVGSILKKLGVSSREAAVKLVSQRSRNLNAE